MSEPAHTQLASTPSQGGSGRTLSRAAAATLALRGSGMAVAALAGVMLARRLGAAGYGTYSWAYAWGSALAIPAALGADVLLVREAGAARHHGRWSALRALVRSALGRVTVVALVVAAATAAIVLTAAEPGERRTALLIALPIVPLAAVAALAQGTLLGLGRTVSGVAPVALGRPIVFLALAVVALGDPRLSSTGVVAIQVAAAAVACLALGVLLARGLAAQPRGDDTAHVAPRTWLRISVPMAAPAVFLLIDSQIGLLVLGATHEGVETGAYAAALLCTAPFALLLAAAGLPLGGIVARLHAAGERAELQRVVRLATRGVALPGLAVAVVLVVAGDSILGVFGEGFRRGAGALTLLAVAHLVNAACAFNGLVLTMGGQERVAMRAALACLLLDAALCLLLVPNHGASGAALALLVSLTARNVANCATTRTRLGIDTTVIGR